MKKTKLTPFGNEPPMLKPFGTERPVVKPFGKKLPFREEDHSHSEISSPLTSPHFGESHLLKGGSKNE